jgi:SlyX protein
MDADKRIDDLEIRLAHQDKMLADMSDMITQQWQKIEALERQLRRVDEEMQSLDLADAHPVTKPPHY